MAKCTYCRGCLEKRLVENRMYFYCFLCKKYYKIVNHKLIEVSEDEVV